MTGIIEPMAHGASAGGNGKLAMSRTRSGQSLRTFGVASLAGGALILAGCGTSAGHSGSPAGSGTSHSSGTAASPLQAILADAHAAAAVSSVRATMTVQAGGATTMTGTEQAQLKPIVLFAADLTTAAAGRSIHLREIVTATAFYMKGLPVPGMASKWVKVPLTGSGALASLGALLDQLRSSNPLAQAQFLAGAQSVRQVGTQVIGGVPTTEYTGSFTAASAASHLPARFRAMFGSMLSMVQGKISFRVWSDSQHLIRKMVVTETAGSQPTTTTIVFSGYNQPVTVRIPAGRQVARIPGL